VKGRRKEVMKGRRSRGKGFRRRSTKGRKRGVRGESAEKESPPPPPKGKKYKDILRRKGNMSSSEKVTKGIQ
jgi:hypothetical protein